MIREFDYNSITFQNIADNEHLEFVCDGDRKRVVVVNYNLMDNFVKNLEKTIKPLVETFNNIAKIFKTIWDSIEPKVSSIIEFGNTKITKKRFKKLLQSHGMQRNEINKIVANNKGPYTYKRLIDVLNAYVKEGE